MVNESSTAAEPRADDAGDAAEETTAAANAPVAAKRAVSVESATS